MKEVATNVSLAFFICANAISWLQVFPKMFPAISVVSFLIVFILNIRDVDKNTFIRISIFVLFILFFFSFSFTYRVRYLTNEYFIYFLFLGIPGLYLGLFKYNICLLFENILLISLLPIYVILNLNEYIVWDDVAGFFMGISYGIIPFICVAFYILINKKFSFFYRMLACVIFIFYVSFLFLYGSRGAFLSILFFALGVLELMKGKRYLYKIIYFSALLIMLLMLFGNFQKILDGETGMYAIDKFVQLADSKGDVSNGRFALYETAVYSILNNPIWGIGIGNYKQYGLHDYPHNLILQILVEGGLIYLIAFLVVFVKSITLLFSSKYSVETKLLILYLLSIGFVGLQFSGYYWNKQFFWLLIGFSISFFRLNKYNYLLENM